MDRESVKRKIQELIEESKGIVVGEEELLLEEEIIDSVSILYIISEVEECYNIRIELEYVTEEHFKNVKSIADYVLSEM